MLRNVHVEWKDESEFPYSQELQRKLEGSDWETVTTVTGTSGLHVDTIDKDYLGELAYRVATTKILFGSAIVQHTPAYTINVE